MAWHDSPSTPGVVRSVRSDVTVVAESDHGQSIPSKRRPAHVPRRSAPDHPRRSPHLGGNPVPETAGESPATVVMGRPCPAVSAVPCPSMVGVAPGTVIVRTPRHADRWEPDLTVGLDVIPAAVLIENGPIGAKLVRQASRGGCRSEPVSPVARPTLERIEAGSVIRLEEWSRSWPGQREALTGSKARSAGAIVHVGGSARDGQIEITTLIIRANSVLASWREADDSGRRVHHIVMSGGRRHPEQRAAPQQAHAIGREQFNLGVVIEVENRAVTEDDLGTTTGSADDVAVLEQRGRIRALADALVSEFDTTLDVREVGGSTPGCGRRCSCFLSLCTDRDRTNQQRRGNSRQPHTHLGPQIRCRQCVLGSACWAVLARQWTTDP